MSRPNSTDLAGARDPGSAEPPRETNVNELATGLAGLHEIVVHGHRVFYRSAGSGPVVVLVHGITSTSATWANVLPYLAERFTVIAPDLLGHGASAKPRGDYSLGAYASEIRDLLIALGHDRATVVGHSLGGGVAMQLAYLFPEHCDRLVLVSSGGLGRDITALLRAASLPGSELVLPLLVNDRILAAGHTVGRALGRIGLRGTSLTSTIRFDSSGYWSTSSTQPSRPRSIPTAGKRCCAAALSASPPRREPLPTPGSRVHSRRVVAGRSQRILGARCCP